jgi:putative lysine transport system permease protein
MTIVTIVTEYATLFLQGIGITLLLAIVGTIAGLLIALLFGYIRVQTIHPYDSKFTKIFKNAINFIVKIYVTVFRGTPMILQAFIFYYGFLHLGINWSALAAGIFTVSLNTGAYLTEVIRGGIGSVDKGQLEAARALGMSETKAMLLIIYPQALKNSMASIGNELIVNIKDTAVLSTIGIIDLFNATTTITGATYLYLEAYSIGAIIYLILTYTSSKLLMYFEKRIGAPVKEITSSN